MMTHYTRMDCLSKETATPNKKKPYSSFGIPLRTYYSRYYGGVSVSTRSVLEKNPSVNISENYHRIVELAMAR